MHQYPRAHVLSSLAVVLHVTAPATIILTAHEIVRIDRVAQSAAGDATAERYGDLLPPGTNTIHLDRGPTTSEPAEPRDCTSSTRTA